MTVQQYHRTLMLIEVLGNEPYNGGIQDLHYSVNEGHFSGKILMEATGEVDAEQMTQLLVIHGSDPSFLVDEDDLENQG